MRASVLKVRLSGRKCPERDLANAPPLIGELELASIDFRRGGVLEVLQLRAIDNPTSSGLLAQLWEPRLIILHGAWMVFRGFESIEKAGVMQEWRCSIGLPSLPGAPNSP